MRGAGPPSRTDRVSASSDVGPASLKEHLNDESSQRQCPALSARGSRPIEGWLIHLPPPFQIPSGQRISRQFERHGNGHGDFDRAAVKERRLILPPKHGLRCRGRQPLVDHRVETRQADQSAFGPDDGLHKNGPFKTLALSVGRIDRRRELNEPRLLNIAAHSDSRTRFSRLAGFRLRRCGRNHDRLGDGRYSQRDLQLPVGRQFQILNMRLELDWPVHLDPIRRRGRKTVDSEGSVRACLR